MSLFNVLVLVGGLIVIFLISIFFIFLGPRIEKISNNAFVLLGLVYFFTVIFLMFPISEFCADKFLKSQNEIVSRQLWLRWLLFFVAVELYWVYRYKKTKRSSW